MLPSQNSRVIYKVTGSCIYMYGLVCRCPMLGVRICHCVGEGPKKCCGSTILSACIAGGLAFLRCGGASPPAATRSRKTHIAHRKIKIERV
jgi:hypothetical protein